MAASDVVIDGLIGALSSIGASLATAVITSAALEEYFEESKSRQAAIEGVLIQVATLDEPLHRSLRPIVEACLNSTTESPTNPGGQRGGR